MLDLLATLDFVRGIDHMFQYEYFCMVSLVVVFQFIGFAEVS